ncbi:putative oxidoreductase/Short-chain dehydrogenase [Serinicoccus hydrothermalis]|uniref:Putative oxidoreductase/Short-chain dehydrogenase n=1 Tax=Serinicoccus hydrothermalis TaxID=1758689 RepID=A0A1B1NFK3_9MICO|nr:putative oxidoreductase/Short-chain dehydrogenase [Serinicoccus hydrothermalis]
MEKAGDVLGWEHLRAPDLRGRTVVVTGASDGIGREAALHLARWGARLVLPVRNRDKGEAVRARLARETTAPGPDPVRLVDLDLADLASVRRAVTEIAGLVEGEQVDLVNVAGVVSPRRQESVDGFELLLGVNALAPMLLVESLLPAVGGRVVLVTSHAHTSGRIDLEDPHFRTTRWSLPRAYSRSKLTAMLWGLDLASRMPTGTELQLVHPGWVVTNLQNASGNAVVDRAVTAASRPLAMTAGEGAAAVLLALTQPLPPGSYVGPDGWQHLRGRPTLIPRSERACDHDLARRVVDWMRGEVGLDGG